MGVEAVPAAVPEGAAASGLAGITGGVCVSISPAVPEGAAVSIGV